jgi:Winged helix DNA-binding domain
VRAALMRGTLHLVTARDYLALYPVMRPVLERLLNGNFRRKLAGANTRAIASAGRAVLEKEPATGAEVAALLQKRWPDRDRQSLTYAVLYLNALVQVPPRGVWGQTARPTWTAAEAWLGRRLGTSSAPDDMIRRYLAAFGPATVADMRAWSSLTGLGDVADRLRRRLRVFQDENGRELFDLPDAPRPPSDTPAPPRFLPCYDNALLSHADRSRIIPPGIGREVFPNESLLVGTVLIDGFVGATWRITSSRDRATLLVESFARSRREDMEALEAEGARLLAFAVPDVPRREVRIVPRPRR